MNTSLINILTDPREHGVTTFLLGMLFILSTYHFFLYFQSKDKTYLFYSIYTALIFIAQSLVTQNDFIAYLSQNLSDNNSYFHIEKVTIEWIYNVLYFLFIWRFVDINRQFSKAYKYVKIFSITLLFLALLIQIISTIFPNTVLFRVEIFYSIIIIPLIVFASIFSLNYLFKANSSIKKYAIIGSVNLLIFSLVAFGIMFSTAYISQFSPIIFYTGVLIENIFFSIGLGKKQKLILEHKKTIYRELKKQVAVNEKLQDELQEKLELEITNKTKTIAALHKKSAEEKLQQLETKYKKELAELKINSLRSQMNPHFIFNSLNSIKLYIIDNDAKKAVFFLNKFSKLIRKILEGTRHHEVNLADELETAKLYLTIENIRFNDEIEITYNIDKNISLGTIKIPPLILQPFLENAIWHGLSAKKDNKKLTLSMKETSNHIIIEIKDNGIGRTKAMLIKSQKVHKNKSIGINLTIERMEQFMKNQELGYALKIEDLYTENNKPIGTKISLGIPKTKTSNPN